jgi:urea-proton symporter
MVTLAFLTIKAINNPAITGLSSFYDVLVEVDKTRDIAGNYRALYSHSSLKSSIIFGLVHSFGDFALVIMDTSFWQKGMYLRQVTYLPEELRANVCYRLCC